jgi:AbrB family looped-hinge helix DNA binding protein
MASGTSRATSKGQITIPIEVRRALGIQPGDVVTIRLDDCGRAIVEPQKALAERTSGMFKDYAPTRALSARELRDAYEEGVAQEVIESMNR